MPVGWSVSGYRHMTISSTCSWVSSAEPWKWAAPNVAEFEEPRGWGEISRAERVGVPSACARCSLRTSWRTGADALIRWTYSAGQWDYRRRVVRGRWCIISRSVRRLAGRDIHSLTYPIVAIVADWCPPYIYSATRTTG